MSNQISAKHLALFAENPRRYCAGDLKQDDLLDNDIAATWPGRGLVMLLLTLGLLGLVSAAILYSVVGLLYAAMGIAMLAVIWLVVAGWKFWQGTRQVLTAQAQIHKLFGLNTEKYELISADILGNRGRAFRNDTLLSVPHTLFRYREDASTVHIGMLVASPVPEGGLSDRDLYRITLHMGLIKQLVKADRVSGSVRYADKILRVTHSDSLYRSLQKLIPELHTGKERGWPLDGRALRTRWQHSTQAREQKTLIKRPAREDWPQAYIV
ncbi:MAG TPA: hypothetical protein VFP95_01545 [Gammaproteobacteria bacterium]|nr:hypothetical protein [Gammaproteobacteria bacterium]